MAASHVPKFGNWDGDNVPYTACFDNARRDKAAGGGGGGGKMINPNDPEENPDAFAFMSPEKQLAHDDYSRSSKKSIIMSPSEESFTDSKSGSGGHSAKLHRRKRPELKKKKNDSSNSFIPAASPNTPRNNGRSNPYDDLSYRSVPKFGGWDEMDPKSSGEVGYTVIFNKVKEEKQIAASKLQPNMNPQQPTYDSTYTHKPSKSKICCCLLFSCCLF